MIRLAAIPPRTLSLIQRSQMTSIPVDWPSTLPPLQTLRACIAHFEANPGEYGGTVELLIEQHREVMDGAVSTIQSPTLAARPPKGSAPSLTARRAAHQHQPTSSPQTLHQLWAGEGELSAALKAERAKTDKLTWAVEGLQDEIQALRAQLRRRDESLKKTESQVHSTESQLAEVRNQLVMSISQNQRFIQQAASERANVSKLRSEISLVQTNNQRRFMDKTIELKDQLLSSVEKLKDMEKAQRATEGELTAVKNDMKNLEHRFTSVAEEYDAAIRTINERDEELQQIGDAFQNEQAHTKSLQQQLTDLKVKYGEVSFKDTLLAKSPMWEACAQHLQRTQGRIHPQYRLLQELTSKRQRKGWRKGREADIEALEAMGVLLDAPSPRLHYLLSNPKPASLQFIPIRVAQRAVLYCLEWWSTESNPLPSCAFPEVMLLLSSMDPVALTSQQPHKRKYALELLMSANRLTEHIVRHASELMRVGGASSVTCGSLWQVARHCVSAFSLVPSDLKSMALSGKPSDRPSMSMRPTREKPQSNRGGVLVSALVTASGAVVMPPPSTEPILFGEELPKALEDANKATNPLNAWIRRLSPPKAMSLRAGVFNTLQVVGPTCGVTDDAVTKLCWSVAVEHRIPGVAARGLLASLDNLFADFLSQDESSGNGKRRNMLPVSVMHAVTDYTCDAAGFAFAAGCERWIRNASIDMKARSRRERSAGGGGEATKTQTSTHHVVVPPGTVSCPDDSVHAFKIVDPYTFYYPQSYLKWKPVSEEDASLAKLAMTTEFNTPLVPYVELFRHRHDGATEGNVLRAFANVLLGLSIRRCREFYEEATAALDSLFAIDLSDGPSDARYCEPSLAAPLLPAPSAHEVSLPVLDVVRALVGVLVAYWPSALHNAEASSKRRFPSAASEHSPYDNFREASIAGVAGVVVAAKLVAYLSRASSSARHESRVPRNAQEGVDQVRSMRCTAWDVRSFMNSIPLVGAVNMASLLSDCLRNLGVINVSADSIGQFEASLLRMFETTLPESHTPDSRPAAIVDLLAFDCDKEDAGVQHHGAAEPVSPLSDADKFGVSCAPLSVVEGLL